MFTTDNAGKLRIGICDDSQADLERIRQAFCKSAEKLGEKDISLYLYRNGKSLCRDCQGNLLEASGTEGRELFSYDVFNHQTIVTMPNGVKLENRYDAEGLRVGTVENGRETIFLYYNSELLTEDSPDGEIISKYIPGYGTAVIWNREKEGYASCHLDEQNSTVYITGPDGEIQNAYQYDAFGVIKSRREGIHNRLLYTGQQYDEITAQYYLRARFYHPAVGRFLQEDVYRGDGLNLYAYCANNPVVYYDPSGYNGTSGTSCKENDEENSRRRLPDSRIGSGTTDGGMNRVTRAWRERYGPGASREHHLIPQEMKKPDTGFFQRLTKLLENTNGTGVSEFLCKFFL